VETILLHWKAIYDGQMKNLDSISHDNSFLNFYPNFFTQRTLLARFQMNNTTPKHVQFIEKPVYAALGLISYLGDFASSMKTSKNISYVITSNGNNSAKFYACSLVTSHVNLNQYISKTKKYEIIIDNLPKRNDLVYFAEFIDNKKTNPSKIYHAIGKPAYPEYKFLVEMRKAQIPMIIAQPTKIENGKIILNLHLTNPFVVAIRICSRNVNIPKRVYNLRIRKINEQEIMLFWSDKDYRKR
jgi:L-iduronidase